MTKTEFRLAYNCAVNKSILLGEVGTCVFLSDKNISRSFRTKHEMSDAAFESLRSKLIAIADKINSKRQQHRFKQKTNKSLS
jgi:hypothetical protein